MTAEEMAKEYAKLNARQYNHNDGAGFCTSEEEVKRAFLAGLEADRPKWHDLRKNPTDVPKENVTVLLLTEVEPVTARYDNEYEAFFRLDNKKLDYCVFIAPIGYIAWCEIPKYTEEEMTIAV